MKTLIVGMGEVGQALHDVLKEVYPTYTKDLGACVNPDGVELHELELDGEGIEIMHICIRHSASFPNTVRKYIQEIRPRLINICTTVPPGTTQMFPGAVHSTTRGLHPNLASGLFNIRKHVGGPGSLDVARYFQKAGVDCQAHTLAITTEVLHLLNNVHYGVNLMFADEAAKICRQFGVDYYDYMVYTADNNIGFAHLGNPTKVRSNLTPPGGKIGGHCVVPSANLIPEEARGPLVERLAHYNDEP